MTTDNNPSDYSSVLKAVRTTTAYVASRLPEGPENFERIATCDADTPLLLGFIADAHAALPEGSIEKIPPKMLAAYLHASACAAWFGLFPADTRLQTLSTHHSECAARVLSRIRVAASRPRRLPPI